MPFLNLNARSAIKNLQKPGQRGPNLDPLLAAEEMIQWTLTIIVFTFGSYFSKIQTTFLALVSPNKFVII